MSRKICRARNRFSRRLRGGVARAAIATAALGAICAAVAAGCGDPPGNTVIIYTSVDQQFAQRILGEFEKQTGIRVEAVFDTEAGKTTGLVRRLLREVERPRCDVWWSSEPFGTIELARAGVLAAYESPRAADIPEEWKDAGHLWTGLAARARVIAYNTQRVKAGELPRTWREFGSDKWASRAAMANPQFGTTRGHVAAMFAQWGPEAASAFLTRLHEAGTRITDGNSMALQAVASGAADICMTDTDDVWVFQRRGEPLAMVYPAMAAAESGDGGTSEDTAASGPSAGHTLWVPCTVALVQGAPNEAAAKRLIDYLVSAEVEQALAGSDSRNVPVRGGLRAKLDFETPAPVAPPFDRIVDAMPKAMRAAQEILLR